MKQALYYGASKNKNARFKRPRTRGTEGFIEISERFWKRVFAGTGRSFQFARGNAQACLCDLHTKIKCFLRELIIAHLYKLFLENRMFNNITRIQILI